MALEAFGVASSVIAVVEISGRLAAVCIKYTKNVKNAKAEVDRLLREIDHIGDTAYDVQRLLEGPNGRRLRASRKLLTAVDETCHHLKKLDLELRPSSTKKTFSKFGLTALKWPLKSKDVDRIVTELGRCSQNITLALQVDQTTILLDMDQKAVLSRLPIAAGAAYDSFGEGDNPTCLENTRVGLLELILDWADDPYAESMFWLSGMAGTGKSTIARTVARSLDETGHLGASFFFKRGEADRNSLHKFITTIASQLLKSVPGTATHIKDAMDEDPSIYQKAMQEQFDKLILEPLSKADLGGRKIPTLVIVIDALDECGGSQADMRRVIHLLSRTKRIPIPRVHIFITSRPEQPIRTGFGLTDTPYKSVALQEMPEYIIQHDITTFLEHELGKIRTDYNATVSEDRRLGPAWPGQQSTETLVRMATPLFIFAATVCRYLADLRWHPDDQLAKILRYETKSQQSKLDATYRPVLDPLIEGLDKIEKAEALQQFRSIVGSIVILARPLSVSSLSQILDIPKRTIEHQLDGLYSVLSVPKLPDVPVRLFHLSFRDFLLDPNKEDDNPFWVDEKSANTKMAANCFRVMNEHLKTDMCNLKAPGTPKSAIDARLVNQCLPDDVQYACVNWVSHLQLAETTICDDDETHSFLKTHFLHWLEALSLMGTVRETVEMVRTLRSLVSSQNSNQILEFLDDGYRLLLSNWSMISGAPLQVYSSVVLFSPQRSSVRSTYEAQLPSWIASNPVVNERWNDLIQTLEGHCDSVTSVCYSVCGKFLASLGHDRTIRMWHTATGDCTQTIQCTVRGSTIDLSHNAELVVFGSADGVVRILDVSTGDVRQELRGHTDNVKSVIFSHDASIVASASDDKTIRIWDREASTCLRVLIGHELRVSSIAFSSNSTLLVSCSQDNTARIWSIDSGECIKVLKGHTIWINSVAYSPNDELIATAGADDKVKLWCVKTGDCTVTYLGHSDQAVSVAFSPDSSLIASSDDSYDVHIWCASTGKTLQRLMGHNWWIRSVAFAPDMKTVASGSGDKTIKIWQVNTKEADADQQVSDSIWDVDVSYDGNYVCSSSYDEAVILWDRRTGRRLRRLETPGHKPITPQFAHNASILVTAADKTVLIWCADTGTCLRRLDGHSKAVEGIVLSRDSTVVASASEHSVRVWRLADGEQVAEFPVIADDYPDVHMDFSLDGTSLAFTDGKQVWVWNLHDRIQIGELGPLTQKTGITSLALSPTGAALVLAAGKSVKLWDMESAQYVKQFDGHELSILHLAFSHDSSLLASTSHDETLRIWDAASGRCIQEVCMGPTPSKVEFEESGQMLVTDLGVISVSQARDEARKAPPNPHVGTGISGDGAWITFNGTNILWLPAEYRPVCSKVSDSTVAIGLNSDKVIVVELKPELLPLPFTGQKIHAKF